MRNLAVPANSSGHSKILARFFAKVREKAKRMYMPEANEEESDAKKQPTGTQNKVRSSYMEYHGQTGKNEACEPEILRES